MSGAATMVAVLRDAASGVRGACLSACFFHLAHDPSRVDAEDLRELKEGRECRHVEAPLQHSEVRGAHSAEAPEVLERPAAFGAESVDDRTEADCILTGDFGPRHGDMLPPAWLSVLPRYRRPPIACT